MFVFVQNKNDNQSRYIDHIYKFSFEKCINLINIGVTHNLESKRKIRIGMAFMQVLRYTYMLRDILTCLDKLALLNFDSV